MTLEITVRGSAEHRYRAELAMVSIAAAIEGSDKSAVFRDAVAVQDPLTARLKELFEENAVATWSSDQVRVYSHRPWDADGKRGAMMHVARVQMQAEFHDFEQLSNFLDHWAGHEGVEVGSVSWDVTPKNRRAYEAEVRKAAVDDAVAKAQTYANAVRRGKVTALHLADPGMLTSQPEGIAPMAYRSADLADGNAGLELTPEEIVIHVDVDARFVAE